MVLFYLGKQRNSTQLPVKENALAFNGQRVWIFSAGRFGSDKFHHHHAQDIGRLVRPESAQLHFLSYL